MAGLVNAILTGLCLWLSDVLLASQMKLRIVQQEQLSLQYLSVLVVGVFFFILITILAWTEKSHPVTVRTNIIPLP